MTNSVDTDEMARNEPYHLDLHCLQRNLFWSTELKRLRSITSENFGVLTFADSNLVPLYSNLLKTGASRGLGR